MSVCDKKQQIGTRISCSWDSLTMPSWRGALSCHKGMARFNVCWRATQVRCHICKAGHQLHATKPNEDLDQPRFPAHSVELSPLCDEVGWRVHLRNVASVHDDHSRVVHDSVQAVSDSQDGAVFKLCADC